MGYARERMGGWGLSARKTPSGPEPRWGALAEPSRPRTAVAKLIDFLAGNMAVRSPLSAAIGGSAARTGYAGRAVGGGAAPSTPADGPEDQDGLLDLLDAKARQFTAEFGSIETTGPRHDSAESILTAIDRLRMQVDGMRSEDVTKPFIDAMLRTMPALTLPSLEQAITGPKAKRGRNRTKTIPTCHVCGSEVANDVCSNPRCAIAIRTTVGAAHKSKPKDAISDRVSEFPGVLNVLLALSELPPHFTAPLSNDPARLRDATNSREGGEFVTKLLAKKPDISPLEICRERLIGECHDLTRGRTVDTECIRAAMRIAQLTSDYIWANGVRYRLTGYRPIDYSPEDRALFLEYYKRALDGFFRSMNTTALPSAGGAAGEAGREDGRRQKNQWSIQSILKLIMVASHRLMTGHDDFYEALQVQGASTERQHAEKWETMRRTYTWTFE